MPMTLLPPLALALGSCLLLVGCPRLHYAQFDGFDASNVASWSMGENIGDIVEFVDERGSSIDLTLMSRSDSEPHRIILRQNYQSDNMPCRNWSVRRYEIQGTETVFRISLGNMERFRGQSPDQQPLTLRILPESLDGVPYGTYLTFNQLNSPESYYPDEFQEFDSTSNSPTKQRLVADATIGSVTFPYMMEQVHDYPEQITLEDKSLATRRVTIANGVGIVQFEQYSGRVFTRASLFD